VYLIIDIEEFNKLSLLSIDNTTFTYKSLIIYNYNEFTRISPMCYCYDIHQLYIFNLVKVYIYI